MTDSDSDDDTFIMQCNQLHSLPNLSDVCWFVRNTSSCQIDDGFIDYTVFVYCKMDGLVTAATVIIILWWLFVFCAMAMTADEFFCPSLAVISKSLRLSHNIAGVTFLALGNGAADIFSSIAAIGNAKSGDAGMAIGALFGAAIAMTAVLVGTIVIVSPFKMVERPFLRDVIFSLLATYWTWYVLWDKKMTQYEALGFIVLYAIYVVVVIVGRYIHQRTKAQAQDQVQNEDGDGPTTSRLANVVGDDSEDASQPLLVNQHPVDSNVSIDYETNADDCCEATDPNQLWQSFLYAINPVDKHAWRNMGYIGRFFECFKIPIRAILLLTIPIVGEKTDDEEDLRNWNKGLNSLHILTGPLCACVLTKLGFKTIGGVFPVWAVILIVCSVLAAIVFFTSKPDRHPVYHMMYAYLSFGVAVVWTYSFANEIVNVLQTIGIIFNLSNALLGLTLLAWGNAIGDFIADFAMARRGYPLMGVSACFGGPLFNILLGLGIPFSIACIQRGGEFHLKVNVEQIVLAGGMATSLVASLIIVPLCGFQMTKSYGIFLLVLYAVFLIVAILTEMNVIPNNDL